MKAGLKPTPYATHITHTTHTTHATYHGVGL